jgi:ABC-type antimicrobial peptide transport system permease subunit
MSSVYGDRFLMLRGVTDAFYRVKGKTFKIREGRNLRDKYDVIIGHLVPRRLGRPYAVGDSIHLENRNWKIVGIFEAARDPVESGAIVKMEDFREVSARGTYSYIEIKADSPKNIPGLMRYVNMAFESLHAEFPDAPAVMAIPERQYWSSLANVFKMAVMVGNARAVVIVVCALLAIMNIYHNILSGRSAEMRVLSASGFSRGEILSGVVLEAFVLSLGAGIIGAVIALKLSGTTINLQMSTVILEVGGPAFPRAVVLGVVLGVAGAIVPALKLTRTP